MVEGIKHNETLGICEVENQTMVQADIETAQALRAGHAPSAKPKLATAVASNDNVSKFRYLADAEQKKTKNLTGLSALALLFPQSRVVRAVAIALGVSACSNNNLEDQPDEPVVPTIKPPPGSDEFPDVNEDEKQPGAGSDWKKSLEDFCGEPAHLTRLNDTSVLATCGDLPVDPNEQVAMVKLENGETKKIVVPKNLLGNTNALYHTAAVATADGKFVYVGYTQELQDAPNKNWVLDSGVHSINAETGQIFYSMKFDQVDMSGPNGVGQVVDSEGNSIGIFTPNKPVAFLTVQDGETTKLIVVNRNINGYNNDVELVAPGTFTILTLSNNTAVAAEASQVSVDANRLPLSQYDSAGAYKPLSSDPSEWNYSSTIMVGDHGLAGAADIGNGTFLTLADIDQKITIFDYQGVATGFMNLPFKPAAQSEVVVLKKYLGTENNFALLGTADGSGRVAMISLSNLEAAPQYYAVFTAQAVDRAELSEDKKSLKIIGSNGDEVSFSLPNGETIDFYKKENNGLDLFISGSNGTEIKITPFSSENISSVQVSSDAKTAYILGDKGSLRTLNLDTGTVSKEIVKIADQGGSCTKLIEGLACFVGGENGLVYSAIK